MTNPTGAPSSSGTIAVLGRTVKDAPALPTSTAKLDAAAPVGRSTSGHEDSRDRGARLRLLAASALGVGCLFLAQALQPGGGSPFAAVSGPAAWTAVICGAAGIWLVPGLWMSAIMASTGPGPAAWLATRIGTTLAWYALVGPVIHVSAQGARVTTGAIICATVAATAATCLGVGLGLLRRPAAPRLRIVLAAVAGVLCAQATITLSMRLWTYDMNFAHIRRLDWLIVLACALLTTVGMHSRPVLPSMRRAQYSRSILVFLAVIVSTALALLGIGGRWSPEQQMPSAFGAEQVAAPAGADLAFALTAIGPEGSRLIQRADFTASDDTGRPVPVLTRLVVGDGTARPATLVMELIPASWPVLCTRTVGAPEQDSPVKLTIRDRISGVLVQGVIPSAWCAR